ncbi:hypothetical protein GGTG_14123 [Gaeumannomyces tritici R3-111a-1]|uniref:Uncharacterized protein n=1 Tax=Gaeumannomyces tritici (strain R3-111a-1) TaxID=644352 RepID=J3PKQ8_GAET3|nr:hypothetical protein GGTG_14123 [Gaeumannomyces tritici R3-111a-1]EJT68296.1 hypothetical protein GGTG_14123 [Gaeumannomyces tritici R3-111a-1]
MMLSVIRGKANDWPEAVPTSGFQGAPASVPSQLQPNPGSSSVGARQQRQPAWYQSLAAGRKPGGSGYTRILWEATLSRHIVSEESKRKEV